MGKKAAGLGKAARRSGESGSGNSVDEGLVCGLGSLTNQQNRTGARVEETNLTVWTWCWWGATARLVGACARADLTVSTQQRRCGESTHGDNAAVEASRRREDDRRRGDDSRRRTSRVVVERRDAVYIPCPASTAMAGLRQVNNNNECSDQKAMQRLGMPPIPLLPDTLDIVYCSLCFCLGAIVSAILQRAVYSSPSLCYY